MSQFVANVLDEQVAPGNDTPPITLPNVSAATLTKVVEFCTYHSKNPTAATKDKDESLGAWDKEFCRMLDQHALFELILTANELEIRSLLDVCCRTMAEAWHCATVRILKI